MCTQRFSTRTVLAAAFLVAIFLAPNVVAAGEAPKGEPTNASEAALQKKYGGGEKQEGEAEE